MKTCTGCIQEKSLNEFNRSKSTKDGLTYRCKDCQKAARELAKAPIRAARKARLKTKTLKYFKDMTWGHLQERTINGSRPRWTLPSTRKYYLNKGIKLLMSRDQWNAFCDENEEIIMGFYKNGITPSLDRIDSAGHYALDNIQIISLKDNVEKG